MSFMVRLHVAYVGLTNALNFKGLHVWLSTLCHL